MQMRVMPSLPEGKSMTLITNAARYLKAARAAHSSHAMVPVDVLEALMLAADDYRKLDSALEFLCRRDAVVTVVEENGDDSSCCTEAVPLMNLARHFGWKEP